MKGEMVTGAKPMEGTGKEVNKRDAPYVSLGEGDGGTNDSARKKEDRNLVNVSGALDYHFANDGVSLDETYGFGDLEVGDGVFVPVEKNQLVAKLRSDLEKTVNQWRIKYAVIFTSPEGDKYDHMIIRHVRQKNDDGSVKLDQNNREIADANQEHHPWYIFTKNWILKEVSKGGKMADGNEASEDGVLIIRVA